MTDVLEWRADLKDKQAEYVGEGICPVCRDPLGSRPLWMVGQYDYCYGCYQRLESLGIKPPKHSAELNNGVKNKMKNSSINWTDHTANFWWGCQKVSEGCRFCYAETQSRRFGKEIWGDPVNTRREPKLGIWSDITEWDTDARAEGVRRRVFVSSMSDFLEDHPLVYEPRERAMGIIENLEWLDILLLTKRPENAPRFLSRWFGDFPAHVWMGTTVENQNAADERIRHLLDVPAKIHFLSVEPMLEKIDLDLRGRNYGIDYPTWSQDIDWVICGGESGKGCRPFDWDWARHLRDQCRRAGVAFWMKQGGGHPNKRHELTDLPDDLQIRETPPPEKKNANT